MALFRHYATPPSTLTIQTTLKSDLESGTSVSASVRDTGYNATRPSGNAFAQNQFVVIEQPGTEKAEIAKIASAVSTADSLTLDIIKHDHPTGTPIALIDFDQIKFYRSTDGETFQLIATKNIAIDQEQTVLMDDDAQPDYMYRYSFYNSITGAESSYSSTYATAINLFGTKYWIRQTIREEANLNDVNMVSDEYIDKKIDEAMGHYLIRQNNWWFLENEEAYEIYTAPSVTTYPLPYDFKSLVADPEFVNKKTGERKKLEKMSFEEYLAYQRQYSDTPYNEPQRYCFGFKGRLCIDVKPDTGNDSIILYYFRNPKPLFHDYAVTDIPDPYIIVYLAVSMLEQINKEIDSKMYRQYAEERIQSSNRSKDFSGKVVQKRKLVGYETRSSGKKNRYFRENIAWTR